MFRPEENRPMNSQFAVRVAVLGGIALVAFAAIFFRLWFLEVLSGEAYLKEANANRVRETKILAPRGRILDTNERVLVDNETSLALQVKPDELFEATPERNDELRRLARVADMKYDKIKQEIRQQTELLPASPVTLQQKVSFKLVSYLRERQDQFPGVIADEIFVREYPGDTLAAHILGYVNEVSAEQLEDPLYGELEQGDRVGIGGLEQQYDSRLRGLNGAVRTQVDAAGLPRGPELSKVEPRAGQDLVLTLDKEVQQAGEEALLTYGGGLPGAFVAMDVNDGSIIGMGSYPTYEPDAFTPPASPQAIDQIFNGEGTPSFNRAVQGVYPTGSTFKLITATAALEEGLLTPEEIIVDDGEYTVGTQVFKNAQDAVYGAIGLRAALQVSSDVFFYTLGARSDEAGKEAIQKWAELFGFGSTTGLDLPAEAPGNVPTPEWRQDLYEEGLTDRPWSVGDAINLSVGQGDLQASPLQLALAYATLANGGSVVRPHLAKEIQDELGRVITEFDPEPKRQIDIDPAFRQVIMDGLRDAAMVSPGTSADIFSSFPIDIAGKTGTAETSSGIDQSWYAAIAPYDNPRYVVAVTVEGGGFGAEAAAPAARDILAPLLNLSDRDLEPVDESIEVAPE